LNKNSARTLEELAEILNDESIVSDCLHTMENIQKKGKWILHKLSKLII